MKKKNEKQIQKNRLTQLFNMRIKLNTIFFNSGPANSEYIELSETLESMLETYTALKNKKSL